MPASVTRRFLTQLLSLLTGAVLLFAAVVVSAQPPGGRGGFGPGGPGGGFGGFGGRGAAAPPVTPEAVPLPTEWRLVDGPGPMFNSDPSHLPGHAPDDYDYLRLEFFVSGMANDEPYTTRVVIRTPGEDQDFSGLVLAESMHSSGAAHMFEFSAVYIMDAGHAAVEILTTSPQQFVDFNAARYSDLVVPQTEANMIIAQIGASIKSDSGPFGGSVRKMVLGGTSMSSQTMAVYMTDHDRLRLPNLEQIYDGYFPTSNGNDMDRVDVPLIQMPTMHEVTGNITRRDDGDEPGNQYRNYEWSANGHVDSRDNIRLIPNPCEYPRSMLPEQAFWSVSLHHLFQWVDEGIVPPKADRIWKDRNVTNDGSPMALDEHGNPLGGIRSPYVDVPVASYHPVNVAADPAPAEVSEWIQNNVGGAGIMCRLSAYQLPFSDEKLRELYGTPRAYRRAFEASLDELEEAGWSLPVYHDIIMGDAEAIDF